MHERLLIQNFISKERQERYLNLIQTKKGRVKLRSYVPHFKDLNKEFIQDTNQLRTSQELYDLLKSKGATDTCYIISEHSDYDGALMNLSEAVKKLFNSGLSFFISCIPGQLAYYEGEEINQRFLLLKSLNHKYRK